LRAWLERLLAIACLIGAGIVRADQVVLAPEEFLRQSFDAGAPPTPATLWLDDAAQDRLKPIFSHAYPQARLHYWRAGGKTVWLLDDIGKEFPITAGFAVKDATIDRAQVLIYRESRGDEIRFPSFLKQFAGARLKGAELSPQIDGISGATLSVWAMQRMARAALTLDALAAP